jgi:hypothetical protein
MHIASPMVVRREPGSIGVASRPAYRAPRFARFKAQDSGAPVARWRKMLPGAVLLTALVAAGGLFPLLF